VGQSNFEGGHALQCHRWKGKKSIEPRSQRQRGGWGFLQTTVGLSEKPNPVLTAIANQALVWVRRDLVEDRSFSESDCFPFCDGDHVVRVNHISLRGETWKGSKSSILCL
jgi:hypothetical protein